MRAPLTKVPLVLPRSRTSQPAAVRSKATCSRDRAPCARVAEFVGGCASKLVTIVNEGNRVGLAVGRSDGEYGIYSLLGDRNHGTRLTELSWTRYRTARDRGRWVFSRRARLGRSAWQEQASG